MSLDKEDNVIRPVFKRPERAPSANDVDLLNARASRAREEELVDALHGQETARNAEEIARGVIDDYEADPSADGAKALQTHSIVNQYSTGELSTLLCQLPNMKNIVRSYAYVIAKTYTDRIDKQKREQIPL